MLLEFLAFFRRNDRSHKAVGLYSEMSSIKEKETPRGPLELVVEDQ
jgi:hypothetical protein